MRISHTAIAIAALACALTACSSSGGSSDIDAKPKASAGEQELTQEQKDEALATAGIPKEPTGAHRQKLIATLTAVAPDVVRYEDKAVDAVRNQCSAINGGVARLDYLAAQRFTYKDVTTTEAQGAKINTALKTSGFCKA